METISAAERQSAFINESVKESSIRRDCFGYHVTIGRVDPNQGVLQRARLDEGQYLGRWAECSYDSDYELIRNGREKNNDDYPDYEHYQDGKAVFVTSHKRKQ